MCGNVDWKGVGIGKKCVLDRFSVADIGLGFDSAFSIREFRFSL